MRRSKDHIPKTEGPRCYISTLLYFHPRRQKIRFHERHPFWFSNQTSPTSSAHSHNELNVCQRVGDQKISYDLGREAGMNDGHKDPKPTSEDPDYIAGYWDGWKNADDWS